MTEKLGTRYSDGSYAEVNQHWHSVDSPYKFGLVNRAIERNNLRFATCADVGCGAGLVTELAAQHYPNSRFDGFEPAPDASTFIDDRANVDNLKFLSATFSGLQMSMIWPYAWTFLSTLKTIIPFCESFGKSGCVYFQYSS